MLKGKGKLPEPGAGVVKKALKGRALNKKLDNAKVDRLFEILMVMIIAISAYNAWHYSGW